MSELDFSRAKAQPQTAERREEDPRSNDLRMRVALHRRNIQRKAAAEAAGAEAKPEAAGAEAKAEAPGGAGAGGGGAEAKPAGPEAAVDNAADAGAAKPAEALP